MYCFFDFLSWFFNVFFSSVLGIYYVEEFRDGIFIFHCACPYLWWYFKECDCVKDEVAQPFRASWLAGRRLGGSDGGPFFIPKRPWRSSPTTTSDWLPCSHSIPRHNVTSSTSSALLLLILAGKIFYFDGIFSQ